MTTDDVMAGLDAARRAGWAKFYDAERALEASRTRERRLENTTIFAAAVIDTMRVLTGVAADLADDDPDTAARMLWAAHEMGQVAGETGIYPYQGWDNNRDHAARWLAEVHQQSGRLLEHLTGVPADEIAADRPATGGINIDRIAP